MTGREEGFLLLTSYLGDPERKVLTPAQLRMLGKSVKNMAVPDPQRDITARDLEALGYDKDMASRIWGLLQQTRQLESYCSQALRRGCLPLSQVSPAYPKAVFDKLGLDGPGSLWCKGDLSLLREKAVALVGSRDLEPENQCFAREVGRQAALQGYVLVSGNARGADQTAQNACLESGGKVISIVADCLSDKQPGDNILYISEDGFDLGFSAQRALSRNRLIHTLGCITLVAQCGYQTGGTWSGTVKNLRFGWSPVFCYADGSPAHGLLRDMGAQPLELQQLENLFALCGQNQSLFI